MLRTNLEFFLGELETLCSEGYGSIISKEQMMSDDILPKNQCSTMFMKPSPDSLPNKFFKLATDSELTVTFYSARYRMPVKDAHMAKILKKYHPDSENLDLSEFEESQDSTGRKFYKNIISL